MNITKRLDRAVQWAGEKMGSEAKTAHSKEFQQLEKEMTVRQEGMENLQKASSSYHKWLSAQDKSRKGPHATLGGAMEDYGGDLPQSEFRRSLLCIGEANEAVADLHKRFAENVKVTWLSHVEQNVKMMNAYQNERKELESRRLAYDASVAKMQKAKQDDHKVEEGVCKTRTKFDDASEDVMRRMQDIQDSEAESIAALKMVFLEAQLEYHEQAAEELRRAKQELFDDSRSASPSYEERHVSRARSNTDRSWHDARQPAPRRLSPSTERLPARRLASANAAAPPSLPPPSQSPRHSLVRASTTYGTSTPLATLGVRVPALGRTASDNVAYARQTDDVFRDDDSIGSGEDGASWGNRSASSATSYDSLCRVPNGHESRKAKPPPPPVNRAKKPPPPPVPARRAHIGY